MLAPTSPKPAAKAKASSKAKKNAPKPEPVVEAITVLPAAAPSQSDIAQRAYEIWLERGGASVGNWLEAERQLRSR